jgi:hypothetical protein
MLEMPYIVGYQREGVHERYCSNHSIDCAYGPTEVKQSAADFAEPPCTGFVERQYGYFETQRFNAFKECLGCWMAMCANEQFAQHDSGYRQISSVLHKSMG